MTPEPVIPISAIEHFVYCPRQCALIHCDGVWSDNAHTARGTRAHRRVDGGQHRMERGRRVLRGIPLWSESLGLSGRADVVEMDGDAIRPVEYKSGVRHGITADLQLCAQALCLEEMLGVAVPSGSVWYPRSRQRCSLATCEETSLHIPHLFFHDPWTYWSPTTSPIPKPREPRASGESRTCAKSTGSECSSRSSNAVSPRRGWPDSSVRWKTSSTASGIPCSCTASPGESKRRRYAWAGARIMLWASRGSCDGVYEPPVIPQCAGHASENSRAWNEESSRPPVILHH